MQFLNPLLLVGSLAVIGPLLLHLIRKEESKKIPFSSLMFVTRLPKRSLRRQTLRHRLLLLMRMVALILLALAFARPFLVSEVAAPLTSSSDKSLVVLVDNSFSTRSGNRFERAREQALKILDSMSAGSTVQFVLYSDTTQVLNNLQAEKSSLRAVLQHVQPTYRKTDHRSALKLAQQLLSSAPNEQREIHWISDFQQSGWTDILEEVVIGDKVKVQPHDVGGTEGGNISISHSQLSRYIEGESQLTRISVRVTAYDTKAPVTARAALKLNGRILQERQFTLPAANSQLIEFDSFAVPPGVSKGDIQLYVSDSLEADNVYHFTLNSQQRVKLLLLGERGSRDSFYVAKALSASKDAPFQLETQDVNQGETLDLSKYSAVLLNNVATVPAALVDRLQEFVVNGGGLITILGSRVRATELSQRLERVLPAKLGNKLSTSSGNKELFIGEIQRQHPIFEIFQNVHHSYFMTTPFYGAFQSLPNESSQVLARLDDGSPLLLTRNLGKGRSLLFTSSLNIEWNDLPLKSVFLPFLHQMVKYSTSYEAEQYAFVVGEVIPMSVLNPMLGRALNRISRSSSYSQDWKVLTPSGKAAELGDVDLVKAPFFSLDEPGFYQSRVHNFDNAVAVNIAPEESDLRKIAPEKVLASLRRVGQTYSGTSPVEASLDQRQAWENKQRIWWYLLLLTLLVLAVESFVSNRYYKGVSESL
jgi:Aerotolerance regulator N-terminal/von Willebrand factor type A domain